MLITSNPLPLDVELSNKALELQVSKILDTIPKDAKLGGMTIGHKRKTRTLVYKGPVAADTDKLVRNIVKPSGFNISTIRNEEQFEFYATRTRENPNP